MGTDTPARPCVAKQLRARRQNEGVSEDKAYTEGSCIHRGNVSRELQTLSSS